MKYKERNPRLIEAEQFDPQGKWPDCVIAWRDDEPRPRDMSWGYIEAKTRDKQKMHVRAGDWIIKTADGIVYPCRPDIFERLYEPAVEVE